MKREIKTISVEGMQQPIVRDLRDKRLVRHRARALDGGARVVQPTTNDAVPHRGHGQHHDQQVQRAGELDERQHVFHPVHGATRCAPSR